ncbi:MAG: AraC family transcriptional regulator [Hyphomonadaceae bacterium]|nr:AraC family transcriptional regulator [Hyphomonadaceae bacterium]
MDALEPAVIHRTSQNLGWTGIGAEIGSHNGWVVDDLVIDGYYLAINIADRPLAIESREKGRFLRKVVPPQTLVVHPFGESFSFRVAESSLWAGVVVSPSLVKAAWDGEAFSCAAQFGVSDPHLVATTQAVVETMGAGPGSAFAAREAGVALAAQLAAKSLRVPAKQSGGLSSAQVRRVADYINDNLSNSLTLDELSALSDLSLWHFARAFKVATGFTPHQFVLSCRLAHARRLLLRTIDPIAIIAAACGFADQAHFTRSFRAVHGTTPGAYRRRSRV